MRKAALIFLSLALLTQRAAVGVGSVCWGLTIALTLCIIYCDKRSGRLSPLPERSRTLLRAIGIYCLCMLPGVIFSYDSASSFVSYATQCLYYTAPVLIGTLAIRNMEKLRSAFIAMMVGYLADCGAAVYQTTVMQNSLVRATGLRGHPNFLGFLCALLAPVLAVVCLDESFKKKERWGGAVLLAAILAGSIACGSRASWVSILITVPLASLPYIYKNTKKALCFFCCAAILISFFATNAQYGKSFFSIGNTRDDLSNIGRIHMWNIGMIMFMEHPLGVGMGQYGAVCERYYAERYSTPSIQLHWHHVHNVYINTLIENGPIGLAGLLYLYLWVLGSNLRAYLKNKDPYALMLTSGTAALMIFFMFDSNFGAPMRIFWFLAGAFTMAQEENK